MTFALAWLAFPAALAVICFGCGLLLEEVARRRLPVLLLCPMGLAFVIVLVQFATISDATAELSVPVAIVAAAAGFGLAYPWGRIDPWALLTPLLAYVAYAAPVALSGEVTFAGYIKLDDTATWFALTDRVMEHGRSLEGLAPSSYEAALAFNLADGYPVGAFLPLGVGRAIVRQDVAWVFQPYLAFLAAMLSAGLYVLGGALLSSGPARMLAAVVAAQPALLFGYALWGGVKELAAAALLVMVAALVLQAMSAEEEDGPRDGDLALIAVACAAMVAVLSPSGGIWLLGVLFAAGVLVVRRHGWVKAARDGALVTLGTAALSAPLLTAGGFLPPTSSPVTSDTARGNLVEPLSWLQIFGVWPAGDFRFDPDQTLVAYVLIAVVAAAALAALVAAWRTGALWVPLFAAGACAACAVIVVFGSPWVEAKALATASPVVVFAALLGAGLLAARRRRIEALAVALAVAGGVLWSNVLAYHEVNLAPHDRHAELERIGERIAGQGPTLMTEYEPYGVRHFLREADPEGASELRRRLVPLRSGRPLRKLGTADIDEFQLTGLRSYRTLVLRRSPVASRPPSVYRLAFRGRYYDVWQLGPGLEDSLFEHIALGTPADPAARPACPQIRELGRRTAAAGGRLAVSRVPRATAVDLVEASSGGEVRPVPRVPGAVYPGSEARFDATVTVRRAGPHLLFVRGSFRRELAVSVDGRRITQLRHRLSHEGHHEPLGAVLLTAGRHRIEVRYSPAEPAPGSGGPAFPLGPLYVVRGDDARVGLLAPRAARQLCGQRLDWVESVSR